MPTRTKQVEGRTITQYAQHVGVSTTRVREWLAAGRLDVIEYTNGQPFGRKGKEPLLILILDEAAPAPQIPKR